jgi:hypothetical protein
LGVFYMKVARLQCVNAIARTALIFGHFCACLLAPGRATITSLAAATALFEGIGLAVSGTQGVGR